MKKLLLFFIITTFSSHHWCQTTFTSVQSGDWNDAATWGGGGFPSTSDNVVILSGHTVDCGPSYSYCSNLTVNFGATLNLESNFGLWIQGSVSSKSIVINGTLNGPGILRISRSTTLSGTGIVNGEIDLRVNSWIFTVDMDLVISAASFTVNASLILNTGNTLTINGTFAKSRFTSSSIRNYGTFIINTNDFLAASSTVTSDQCFRNYANIELNYVGDFPHDLLNNHNNITISGGIITLTSDINMTGDFVNNSSLNTSAGNNITFNGTNPQSVSGTGTYNLNDLTLNNSNGLTLSSGTINITNALISTSGTITQNGASVTLLSNSANTAGLVKLNSASDYSYSSGDFTVQRYYNGTQNGWRMVAAPIKSATLAVWDDEFIYCGISGGTGNFSYAGCGSFYSVYEYDESAAVGHVDNGLSEVTSIGFGVSNAKGTLIYTSSGATTVSVTGTPEFDDIAKSVTNVNDGWNLVANPYPSTIDWLAFTTENLNITGNVWYAYNADAATYLSNSSNIPHSQGFWINSSSSTNLNFSVSETVANQATFIKSTNGIDLPLKLMLTNNVNSYFDYAYLKTGPNYSNNFDSNADALKLFTPYPDYNANIYFLDNQGNSLDRSSINNNLSENILFDVKIGQYAHGDYTIQFENLKQFMIGSCLTLEDLHNGVITDLRQDSIYTFSSDTNAPSPRFKLQIDVDYEINVSNAMCFNDSSAFISLKGLNLQGHYFNLIDTSGLLIDSVVAVSDSITFNELNAGVFQYETNHLGSCPTHNQLIYVTEPEEVISMFSTISDTFYLDTNNQILINFRNLSTGSAFYEWDLGDGNSSNNFSVNHTYTSPGIYSVKLISKMDSIGTCVDEYEKMIYIIDPFANIVDEFFAFVNVFQMQNELTIEYGNNFFKFCYLSDISGKRITNNMKREAGSSIIKASIPSTKPGIYFLCFEQDNGRVFTTKVFLN